MKENIYTTGCKTVSKLWLAAVAVCVAVVTRVENAVGLLLKIEGDLCGIFGRFGWSFGVCLAGVVRFGSNMVRMMLSGFPRGAVCRTSKAYFSPFCCVVPASCSV